MIIGRSAKCLHGALVDARKSGDLGEAGFNAYDIARLVGHVNISSSQRYVRSLPVGSGEAVLLKNQRRHNTVRSKAQIALAVVARR